MADHAITPHGQIALMLAERFSDVDVSVVDVQLIKHLGYLVRFETSDGSGWRAWQIMVRFDGKHSGGYADLRDEDMIEIGPVDPGEAPAGLDWRPFDIDDVPKDEPILALYRFGKNANARTRMLMIRWTPDKLESFQFLTIAPRTDDPDFYIGDPQMFARINLPAGFAWPTKEEQS